MSESSDLVKNDELIRNGEFFKVYGSYTYAGHVNDAHDNDCRVPDAAYRMVFQEGDEAPKLPSCSHEINWLLLRKR